MPRHNSFILLLFLSGFGLTCGKDTHIAKKSPHDLSVIDYIYTSGAHQALLQVDQYKYNRDLKKALAGWDSLLNTNLTKDEYIYVLNQAIYASLCMHDNATAKPYFIKLDNLKVNWTAENFANRGDYYLNKAIFLLNLDSLSDETERYFELAVSSFHSCYPSDHIKQAQCLVWRGLLKLKKQPDAAQSYFETAFQMYAKHPNWKLGQPECKLGLATFKMQQRAFPEAISYCDSVIELGKVAPKENVHLIIQAYNTKEACLMKMGETSKAIRSLNNALEIAEKYGYKDIGSILYSISQVYINIDTTRKAIFEKIAQISTLENQGLIEAGMSNFVEGIYYLKKKNWKQGIKAMEVFLKKPLCQSNMIFKDQSLYSLAISYQNIGKFDQAITFIKEDINLGKEHEVFYEKNGLIYPIAKEASEYEFNALSLLGRLFLRKYHQTNLLKDLKQSTIIFSSLDSLYTSKIADKDDATLLSMQSEFVDSCYPYALESTYAYFKRTNDSFWKNQAFRYSERLKSGIMLREMLNRQDGHEGSYGYWQDSLRKVQNQFNRLTLKTESGEALSPGEQTIFKALAEIQTRLLLELKEKSKLYFQKANGETQELDKVQANLGPDEAIIHYALGPDHLHILYIDREQIDFIQKDNVTNIRRAIMLYRDYLTSEGTDCKRYVALSNMVFGHVLSPFGKRLKKDKKVLIIPDGALQYIPFEALVDPEKLKGASKGFLFGKLPYLVHSHQISYAPSWKVHVLNSAKNNSVVPNAEVGIWVDTSVQFWNNGCLDRYQTVLGEANTHAYYGGQCTKGEFISHYRDLDIINFIVHGLSNQDSYLDYKLVFAENGGETLYGYEVQNMHFNRTQLMVLGVCDGNNGKQTSSEGPATLTRSFMQAGIPWVIGGLYPIEGNASNEVLIEFYKQLAQSNNISFALQQAKIKYLAREKNGYNTHPYYWAGLVAQH